MKKCTFGTTIYEYRMKEYFKRRAQAVIDLPIHLSQLFNEPIEQILTEQFEEKRMEQFLEEKRMERAQAIERRKAEKAARMYAKEEQKTEQKEQADKRLSTIQFLDVTERVRMYASIEYYNNHVRNYTERVQAEKEKSERMYREEQAARIRKENLRMYREEQAAHEQERIKAREQEEHNKRIRESMKEPEKIGLFHGLAIYSGMYYNSIKKEMIGRKPKYYVFPVQEQDTSTYMYDVYNDILENTYFHYIQVIAVLKKTYAKSGNPFIYTLMRQAQIQYANKNRLHNKQYIQVQAKETSKMYNNLFKKYFKRRAKKVSFTVLRDTAKEIDICSEQEQKKDVSFNEYPDINDMLSVAHESMNKLYQSGMIHIPSDFGKFRYSVQSDVQAYIDSMKAKKCKYGTVQKVSIDSEEIRTEIDEHLSIEDNYPINYEVLKTLLTRQLAKEHMRKDYNVKVAVNCFVLHDINGYTEEQIARIVGVNRKKVSRVIHDCIVALKNIKEEIA